MREIVSPLQGFGSPFGPRRSGSGGGGVPNVWSSVGLMTDIDSDIDDVVADALLFDLLAEAGLSLSYVSVASRSNTAAYCQRILLNQAGRSGVPLGQMQTPVTANSSSLYNDAVAALFPPTQDRTTFSDNVVVMRTALAAMPDQSHKIITIGNLTDYAALLQSPADGISPLNGIQLVAAKVISVHSMGGRYPSTATTESNVNGDIPAANYVATNTPVPIYWAPYALGVDVFTRIPTAGFNAATDAYVVAWNAYGVASRESWDSIPVLHAMLGLNGWFTDLGAHDVSFTSGSTWTPNASGKNYPLGRTASAITLRDYINGRVDRFMDDFGIKATLVAPSTLFGVTEQGYWIDPSDLTTMFQDIAGTVPVTAAGQRVGRILDKSGKGNHFVAPSDAARPTWQQDDALRGYLTGGYMNTASAMNAGTDKVQLVSGLRKGTAAATVFLCEFSPTIDTNSGSFFASAPHDPTFGNNYGFRARGSVLPATLQTGPGGDDIAVFTATADIAGDSRVMRRNSVAGTTSAADMGTGNFGNYSMFLMARSGGTLLFTGRLYQQVCRFGANLSAGDLSALEVFVNTKTGAT